MGGNEDLVYVQNSRANQTKRTLDTLEKGFEGPPRNLESRPLIHRHRYTNTDNPKLTPEPPATISTLEYSIQSVLATEPNGPSTNVRSRIPRLGGYVPSGGASPSQWNLFLTERATTVSQSVLVQPAFARMKKIKILPAGLQDCWSQTEPTVNGWEVNLLIDGMERRKCCPGAHVRHSGVRTARRIVFPGISSAWAYPAGGRYVVGGAIKLSTLVGIRECFRISGAS